MSELDQEGWYYSVKNQYRDSAYLQEQNFVLCRSDSSIQRKKNRLLGAPKTICQANFAKICRNFPQSLDLALGYMSSCFNLLGILSVQHHSQTWSR